MGRRDKAKVADTALSTNLTYLEAVQCWWFEPIWRPFSVGGSNPAMDKIFCNVHLLRVPLS